jgi:predicted DCC family thiol-disulfide oxidoreductase YuxK
LVVHFDEDCGFCSACVRVLRRLTDPTVTYAATSQLEDPRLARLAEVAIIVTGEGAAASGVDGVALVLGRCGILGRLAGAMLRVPVVHGIAAVVYARIAANRQWISRRLGLKAACELHGFGGGPATGA